MVKRMIPPPRKVDWGIVSPMKSQTQIGARMVSISRKRLTSGEGRYFVLWAMV